MPNGNGARSPKEILSGQTIVVKRDARVDLLERVRKAFEYGAGERRFRRMPYYHNRGESFESHYARRASDFAAYILTGKSTQAGAGVGLSTGWTVPEDLNVALGKLRTAADTARFLLIRGLFPVPWFWTYSNVAWDATTWKRVPKTPKRVVSHHYYDLIASMLLHYMGVRHTPKMPSGAMYFDYLTAPDIERDVFSPDADVPCRYRTVDPELHFVQDVTSSEGHLLSSRYTIYLCIENPNEEPLYVLSAEKVVERLSPTLRSRLAERRFVAFDNWDQNLSLQGRSKVKPLLSADTLGPRLSYDANRLYLQHAETKEDLETREAIAALRYALQHAAVDAIPVPLARGDALVVDNHRLLVRDAEGSLHHRWWSNDARSQTRWIRLYAGYPSKNEARQKAPLDLDPQSVPPLTREAV